MLFLLLAILVILLIIIWAITHDSKSKKFNNYYYPPYYNDPSEDFESEPFEKEDTKSVSSFAYPDPYEMALENRLFLNEDGELREDL